MSGVGTAPPGGRAHTPDPQAIAAVRRAEALASEARDLAASPPVAADARGGIESAVRGLGAAREEGLSAGPDSLSRLSVLAGRLVFTGLSLRRDRASGAADACARRLLQAAAALVDAEEALSGESPSRETGMDRRAGPAGQVLRSAAAVQAHLETQGDLRGVRVAGVTVTFSLAGVDLSQSEWASVDLTGVSLRGAVARGAKFRRCTLVSADLTQAEFKDAVLDGVDLSRATLSGVDFTQARLVRGLQLAGADLRRARFLRAKLDGVDLRGASLEGASLVQCLLSGANAEGAVLDDCDLTDSQWKGACLRGATGLRVKARRIGLGKADLRRAKLPGIDASSADARGADFEGADLEGARLRGASLEGATLRGVILRRVVLDEARLAGADIRKSSLASASLRLADLSHARLEESHLVGASLVGATLHRTQLTGADLTGADLRQARRTDESGARAEDFRPRIP